MQTIYFLMFSCVVEPSNSLQPKFRPRQYDFHVVQYGMTYITGDTHGKFEDLKERLKGLELKEDDILIVCGDFGFDWNEYLIEKWKAFEHPYTVLFCDGNHENFDILNDLPSTEMFGSKVGIFAEKTYRLLTGCMYDIQGTRTFVFGGASSIDKDWRVDPWYVSMYGKLWWEEEIPSPESFSLAQRTLEKHRWTFDLFLSHTCRPELKRHVLETYKADFFDPTEAMIADLEDLIKENGGCWKVSCFGHFHTDVDYGKHHCLYERVVELDNLIQIQNIDIY